MQIQLSDDREQLVRSFLHGGEYGSEDEVIDAALRLLQERDDKAKLTRLRREIAIGIEQAERVELEPFDPQTTFARVRSRQAANSELT